MNLAITLIEKNNSESPNIGTVLFKGDLEDFKSRIKLCIESHFDAEVVNIKIQDDLDFVDVYNSYPLDALVKLEEDAEVEIEIQQTWIY